MDTRTPKPAKPLADLIRELFALFLNLDTRVRVKNIGNLPAKPLADLIREF